MATVGHFPREVSRFVHMFVKHEGTIAARLKSTAHRRSKITQGGLELVMTVEASHTDTRYVERCGIRSKARHYCKAKGYHYKPAHC